MGSQIKLVWKETAKISLSEIYFFIRKDSPSAAKKVRNEIIDLAKSLIKFPYKFSKEFFFLTDSGNIRFVPIYSYKIIYEITDSQIIILDIFHTSRNPESISK